MIDEKDISKHYKDVCELFKKYKCKIEIRANKTVQYTLSPKKGFSVIIEKTNIPSKECIQILTEKVQEIKNSPDDIKKEFVKGCFDGRSSWDTKSHYLSVDVDRNDEKKDLIAEIIRSLNIDINMNGREPNHKKNDQIRIKYNSVQKFIEEIGLYSSCRKNIIEKAIKELK